MHPGRAYEQQRCSLNPAMQMRNAAAKRNTSASLRLRANHLLLGYARKSYAVANFISLIASEFVTHPPTRLVA